MRRRPGVRAPEGRWLTATSRAGRRLCRRRRRSRPAVAATAETRDWCWRELLHHELPLQISDASHLTSSPGTHCAIAQPPCPKCHSACCLQGVPRPRRGRWFSLSCRAVPSLRAPGHDHGKSDVMRLSRWSRRPPTERGPPTTSGEEGEPRSLPVIVASGQAPRIGFQWPRGRGTIPRASAPRV
jgi:hypothetical protein